MTIIIEVSRPMQLKPFRFSSASMFRIGWLWFAIGWLRVPFKEFSTTAYDWSYL
jgi:hypothetical protein